MKAFVRSMRLRTLPLSLSGVMCGGVVGYGRGSCSVVVLVALLLTTVALQVLSNLSNEMGDYRNGVDSEGRVGPSYGMANGMSERQLWRAINWTVVACCVFGFVMVVFSFGPLHRSGEGWMMIVLGALAIWAATHYTLGAKPYGYRGLGDLFVFLFFGIVAVLGSYFVVTHCFEWAMLWPAVGVGLLSIGVLNVNNIRDMATDEGIRRTIPLRIGLRAARVYQTVLVTLGWMAVAFGGGTWWIALTAPLMIGHLYMVWSRKGRALDGALPLLVVATFCSALVYTINCYGL